MKTTLATSFVFFGIFCFARPADASFNRNVHLPNGQEVAVEDRLDASGRARLPEYSSHDFSFKITNRAFKFSDAIYYQTGLLGRRKKRLDHDVDADFRS